MSMNFDYIKSYGTESAGFAVLELNETPANRKNFYVVSYREDHDAGVTVFGQPLPGKGYVEAKNADGIYRNFEGKSKRAALKEFAAAQAVPQHSDDDFYGN